MNNNVKMSYSRDLAQLVSSVRDEERNGEMNVCLFCEL